MRYMKQIGLLFLVATFALSANAQKDYKKEGDLAFNGLQYYKAISSYKKAIPKASANDKAYCYFKIGESYRITSDLDQALVNYEKAVLANYKDPIALFHIAECYKAQGNYEKAIVQFRKYKEAAPNDKRAEDGIKSSTLAAKWLDDPSRIIVNPMPLLNSEKNDYAPAFSDKKNTAIYFSSTRQSSDGADISNVTGDYFPDIYTATRSKIGKWSEPVLIDGEDVNTDESEAAPSLPKKKDVLYFTRCGKLKKKGAIGCSIWVSRKAGQSWAAPEVVPIATGDSVIIGHPAVSSDGNTLIFTSNLPGGQGKADLWYITYNKKAKTWSEPTNLGPGINTSETEMYPFLRDNGELYFSSDGQLGMGGLDIFKANSTGDKVWGEVENMNYPLNSQDDDFGIVFESNQDRGLFTTNRKGGLGADDIWQFYLPPMIFSLEGIVKDVETDLPLANAKVVLTGSDGTKGEQMTDENGNFSFIENGPKNYINAENTYELTVSKKDYLTAKGKESTMDMVKSQRFFHEYALQPIGTEVVKLPQINYLLDKWDLLPESKDSLNHLYDIMVNNPTIVIQLRSHTDFRGSHQYNQGLSQKRAQSCVDYLVDEKGIARERLEAMGIGENEPLKIKGTEIELDEAHINALKTTEEKEAAHLKNRRTDFRVIRQDYVPKVEEGAVTPAPTEGEK